MRRCSWWDRIGVVSIAFVAALWACEPDDGPVSGATGDVEPISDAAEGATIAAHIAQVQFYDWLPRADTATVICRNADVLLRIDPATDLLELNPYDTLDLGAGEKRVIGRIVNIGTEQCARLGIQRGDTTYWWLRKPANDTIVLSNYSPDGTLTATAVEDTLRIIPYDATASHAKPDSASARWRDSVVTASIPRQFHFASIPAPIQTGATALVSWGSCDQGCCSSGGNSEID